MKPVSMFAAAALAFAPAALAQQVGAPKPPPVEPPGADQPQSSEASTSLSPSNTQSPTADISTLAPTLDFHSIDKDRNGALSMSELKVVDTNLTQSEFNKYDANKNKKLSQAEFEKWWTDKAAKKTQQ